MFEIIALLIVALITYKIVNLHSWTHLVDQYTTAATGMGLDSEEAVARLKLYCDTFKRPTLNGKQEFQRMMQANGTRSDPHAHTVQVMWHLTDDIVYLGVSHCSKLGLEALLPAAELKTALAGNSGQNHSLAYGENMRPAPDTEYIAGMPIG